MYANKVNGHVFAGSHLTGSLQFYVISTTVDITGTSPASVAALDKLVEVISLNGQPVIMGSVIGSGPYALHFAVEHAAAWVDAATFVAAIKQHAPAQFGSDTNLSVTVGQTLGNGNSNGSDVSGSGF